MSDKTSVIPAGTNILIHANIFDRADAIRLDTELTHDTRFNFTHKGSSQVHVILGDCLIKSRDGHSPVQIQITESGDTYIVIRGAVITNDLECVNLDNFFERLSPQASAAQPEAESPHQITCSCGIVFPVAERTGAIEHAKQTKHSIAYEVDRG